MKDPVPSKTQCYSLDSIVRSVPMLDAYIIERIRREKEDPSKRGVQRAQIEAPRPERRPPPPSQEEEPVRERGVVIIDFNI